MGHCGFLLLNQFYLRVIILLLKMHRPFDLVAGEFLVRRSHYQLIFNIIFAVSDADYSARKALHRLVDADEINIKFLAVAAENTRNVTVMSG